MRIAIVGSGVSGLVAAYLLSRNHNITVYEATNRVGGHVHTIEVQGDNGPWAVDTGFIVYNEQTYPHFTRLLARLDVPTQPSSMSFSVRSDATGLEYNGTTIRKLFAQRRNVLNPTFYRMVFDILRFNKHALPVIENGAAYGTLGDYVAEQGYSRGFVNHYLLPMGSALWSIPRTRVLEMPLVFFVRFFANHGMLTVNDRPEWRVISGGSAQYVSALTQRFRKRIRLNHRVRRISRHEDRVEIDGEPYDHVVIACHSDQALGLLADPTAAEHEVLGALPYQGNDAVLHTDTSVLPKRRSAWAAWNYRVCGAPEDPSTITYNMNILQTLRAPTTYCVTLNGDDAIDPGAMLARMRYEHPVYSLDGTRAQRRYAAISGVHRTHYCGAYWGYGFHEDGVRSALAACAFFGETL